MSSDKSICLLGGQCPRPRRTHWCPGLRHSLPRTGRPGGACGPPGGSAGPKHRLVRSLARLRWSRWAGLPLGGSGETSAPKRLLFLMFVRTRLLFLCWLLARGLSQHPEATHGSLPCGSLCLQILLESKPSQALDPSHFCL